MTVQYVDVGEVSFKAYEWNKNATICQLQIRDIDSLPAAAPPVVRPFYLDDSRVSFSANASEEPFW
jgi:hypothetical protein